MRSSFHSRRTVRLGLVALMCALEVAFIAPATSFAQAAQTDPVAAPATATAPPATPAASQAPVSTDAPPCPGSVGAADYPISGGPTHAAGWFFTEEACRFPPITGVGPARARGFPVVDDDNANFWTEFRRFGGVDVLGYPVSQPYHYPVGNPAGYWYQAFERGILQYHPETGRAEMANVFEQFSESDPCHADRPDDTCLDNKLMYFGIPQAQGTVASTDTSYGPEQRMSWLTEPRFLARYFFDPVAFHSSEPQRDGTTAFATQEQAWAFFGLPQTTAQRMVLRAPNNPSQQLWPLLHSFSAQRFQKGGLELFMEDAAPESFDFPLMNGDINRPSIFDPTIVPGDGKKGCVALTAVGLLARSVGADKMIPNSQLQPVPVDPSPKAYFMTYIPRTKVGQFETQFQIDATGYLAAEPVTITLSDGQTTGSTASRTLPSVTAQVEHTNADGSFTQVMTAQVGSYRLTAVGTKSGKSHSVGIDLSVPTVDLILNRPTSCTAVGLPVAN